VLASYSIFPSLLSSLFHLCLSACICGSILVPASRLRSLSVILLIARPARTSHFGAARTPTRTFDRYSTGNRRFPCALTGETGIFLVAGNSGATCYLIFKRIADRADAWAVAEKSYGARVMIARPKVSGEAVQGAPDVSAGFERRESFRKAIRSLLPKGSEKP
jgi:hypothetical protein